ncbi:MAG: LysR family transcriptional regulator [Pseudomonadota bacterium]
MKNYRHLLPPLDYLLFFEAVARHRNFTRAAEELNVSQAAVSKRVKVLEDWLDMPLVYRHGRRIELSRNGENLAEKTRDSLDYLAMGLQQIRRSSDQDRLSLAASVAIAQYWLTPRINEYLLSPGAVPVTLTASDKDSDLFSSDADAILFYGPDIPVGWDGIVLFEEIWMPVAAAAQAMSFQGFETATLLDFDKLTPKWINWGDFAELTGNAQIAGAKRVNLRSYGSTLETATHGRGIALGCPDVLRNEIEAGRLVGLADFEYRTGRCNFLIWRPGHMSDRRRALLGDVGICF